MSNWNSIYDEIEKQGRETKRPHDAVRARLMSKFQLMTGRNLVAYYSGWLQKTAPQFGNIVSISDEDKNGFMACFHGLDFTKGLDLILHSPGGSVAATESIIHYIRSKFGSDVRVFVPQLSMSGGTMIALAASEIWMGTHSNLGPIDPQFGSMPARLVISEFEKAATEVQTNPERIHVWRPILSQIPPTFLSTCQNAIDWSEDIAIRAMQDGMFKGRVDGPAKAKEIAKALSEVQENKDHSRHLHRDKCEELGLVIRHLESDQSMQDAVLAIHHAFMICLMETPAAKLIENHLGQLYGKAVS